MKTIHTCNDLMQHNIKGQEMRKCKLINFVLTPKQFKKHHKGDLYFIRPGFTVSRLIFCPSRVIDCAMDGCMTDFIVI